MREEHTMYPLGHFALAYFLVQFLGLFVEDEYNILLIWVVSILPDIDFLFHPFLVHRGATHSIIMMILISIPTLIYVKKSAKYLASMFSHLIGDYLTYSGIMLLWPISKKWYMAKRPFLITTNHVLKVEALLFLTMILHMVYVKTRPFNDI